MKSRYSKTNFSRFGRIVPCSQSFFLSLQKKVLELCFSLICQYSLTFPFPLTVPNAHYFSHRDNSFCSHAAGCPIQKSTCCLTQRRFLSCSLALLNYSDVGCNCICSLSVRYIRRRYLINGFK